MAEPEAHASSDDGTHPAQAFCACGSAWFNVPTAFEHDGSVNGQGAVMTCLECHMEYPVGFKGAITESGEWFDPAVHGTAQ